MAFPKVSLWGLYLEVILFCYILISRIELYIFTLETSLCILKIPYLIKRLKEGDIRKSEYLLSQIRNTCQMSLEHRYLSNNCRVPSRYSVWRESNVWIIIIDMEKYAHSFKYHISNMLNSFVKPLTCCFSAESYGNFGGIVQPILHFTLECIVKKC